MTEITTETRTKAKSGRKPIDDKKVPITIYRKKSDVDKLGGGKSAREMINELINSKLNG